MKLNKITSTCSMYELGDVLPRALSKKRTKKEFINWLTDQETIIYGKDKCIIYNSTNSTISKRLRKIGFKKVFSYTGQGYVSVYMLRVRDLERNWFKRLLNIDFE